MIPTVINTLETNAYETIILMDQYIKKLDVYGISSPKQLMYKRIIETLIINDFVSDDDKLMLNLILIKLKKTLKIF